MILKDAPEGFQPTEIGLIPVDWKLKQAKDISGCIVPGRNKPKKFDGIIPWVTTSDIDKLGKIDNSKISLFISKEEANAIGSRVVPANAVIMSCVGELGVVCVAENEIVINQQLHAFLPNSKINSKYLSYILSSLKEYFYSKATKTTLPYLNKDNCNSTPIPLPCIEEQTAIANALSDVDALLTELEMLITKKQAIKTATMQQLLTGKTRLPQFATYTEGENQGAPKGKSKGTKPSELGEIPEDWDVSTIADISLVPMQNGLFYEPARKGKGVPLINVSDMYTSAPISVESLELFNASKTELKAFKVNEGDLFFTRSSIVPSGIAFCNVLPKSDKEVVFDSHLIRVRVNPKIADYNYVYLNCLAKHSRLHLIANSKTATMTTIDQKAINCCPVLLPCKEEQTAIATILSDMDNEIQTLEQRLTKTRQIKQGMMQQLLTGRTRLPY